MKALVVYDSLHGNTERIAKAIASTLGIPKALRAVNMKPEQLKGQELVIVGSPTHRFKPSTPMQDFLLSIPSGALKGVDVAAFDTRMAASEVSNTLLRFFMKIGSYAAGRIGKTLVSKGGNMVIPPEGFIVKGMEGPLKDGEIERAAGWAKSIIEARRARA